MKGDVDKLAPSAYRVHADYYINLDKHIKLFDVF